MSRHAGDARPYGVCRSSHGPLRPSLIRDGLGPVVYAQRTWKSGGFANLATRCRCLFELDPG